MDIEKNHKNSMFNRSKIEMGGSHGCFFCLTISPSHLIVEWADDGETALCPHCGIDSILPHVKDEEFLVAMCERWFTRKAQLTEEEPSLSKHLCSTVEPYSIGHRPTRRNRHVAGHTEHGGPIVDHRYKE